MCADRPVSENRDCSNPTQSPLQGRPGGKRRAPRQRPAHAARARVRPGAESQHGRVLELRDLVHDHLDPLRDADALRHRPQLRRPGMEAYGWPVVSVFVIIVGLGMAEIASKYPTAGGLYYWASKMGGPVWGWFTGWFNLIGQIAITAGIDYGAATFTDALLQLLWPGSFHGTQHEIVAVYAVILGAARADEHLQRPSGRVPQRRLGLVARRRRADHRRVPGVQTRPPPIVQLCLRAHDQQQRLRSQLAVVRAAPRPPAGAVHVHGLRRVRAHERRDAGRVALGGTRCHRIDRRLRRVRVHPGAGCDVRDPESDRDHGRGRICGQAGVPRFAGLRRGEVRAVHLRRRAVLLRHVVDHVGIAHDVRVLTRWGRSGPPALAAP